jgi:hypothetical protein
MGERPTLGLLALLLLVLAAPPVRADPPADDGGPTPYGEAEDEFAAKIPQRERDLIQIIEDARKEAATTHSYKDARMGLQIRVARLFQETRDLAGWQGTVQAIHTTDEGDVSVSLKIADGVTFSTSPTRMEDPYYVSLIRKSAKLSAVAARLKTGQRVFFDATLLRYVNDSDEDMIKSPRLLGHFIELKPLE